MSTSAGFTFAAIAAAFEGPPEPVAGAVPLELPNEIPFGPIVIPPMEKLPGAVAAPGAPADGRAAGELPTAGCAVTVRVEVQNSCPSSAPAAVAATTSAARPAPAAAR